jgi:sulfatase modifying factor 1
VTSEPETRLALRQRTELAIQQTALVQRGLELADNALARISAIDTALQPLPVWQQIGIEMIPIPAGPFLMGSDKAKDKLARDDELPLHTVYLPAFRIARVPVTVAQFAQFVAATGYKTTAEMADEAWKTLHWGNPGFDWRHPGGPTSNVNKYQDHPVTCILWRDAQAFCRWAGVRLPTEAEWEKAARGTDGRIFPWGDRPNKEMCNFSGDETTPVGRYSPQGDSPYGIADMAGNVWEWCDGWYDEDEDARPLRGGAGYSITVDVRCAAREGFFPGLEHYYIGYYFGFRVVSPGF